MGVKRLKQASLFFKAPFDEAGIIKISPRNSSLGQGKKKQSCRSR
jgi:hypothetical protein